jgi:hypothetical protein
MMKRFGEDTNQIAGMNPTVNPTSTLFNEENRDITQKLTTLITGAEAKLKEDTRNLSESARVARHADTLSDVSTGDVGLATAKKINEVSEKKVNPGDVTAAIAAIVKQGVTPQEAAGIILSNLEKEGFVNIENFANGLDLNDTKIEAMVQGLPGARASLESLKKNENSYKELLTFKDKYTKAAEELAKAENINDRNPTKTSAKSVQEKKEKLERINKMLNKDFEKAQELAKKMEDENKKFAEAIKPSTPTKSKDTEIGKPLSPRYPYAAY